MAEPPDILHGIRVVECCAYQLGPAAGAMLADLGADVIKIEEPGKGDPHRGVASMDDLSTRLPEGRSAFIEDLNRGKLSVTLNLKHPKGRHLLVSLTAKSDVFLTNYLPGTLRKLGLDSETLRSVNSRLIYASATGFGRRGPLCEMNSFEPVFQAKSGIMLSCGEPGAPPVVFAGGFGDRSGGILLAYSVLAALLARERYGVAQEAWTSGLAAMIVLQNAPAAISLMTGQESRRTSAPADRPNPLYSQYCCQDGRLLQLAASPPDVYWESFCGVLGVRELATDRRFATREARAENRLELRSILEPLFSTRTSWEWEQKFLSAQMSCSVVRTLDEALSDEQVVENEYVVEYDHPVLGTTKMLGFPVQFSNMPARIRRCAPEVGQDTEEVLTEILGLSWENIEQLRLDGVI